MDGRLLALGSVAAVAAAGWVRQRGSATIGMNVGEVRYHEFPITDLMRRAILGALSGEGERVLIKGWYRGTRYPFLLEIGPSVLSLVMGDVWSVQELAGQSSWEGSHEQLVQWARSWARKQGLRFVAGPHTLDLVEDSDFVLVASSAESFGLWPDDLRDRPNHLNQILEEARERMLRRADEVGSRLAEATPPRASLRDLRRPS